MTCSRHPRHHPCRHHHNNLIDASSISLCSILFYSMLFCSFPFPLPTKWQWRGDPPLFLATIFVSTSLDGTCRRHHL